MSSGRFGSGIVPPIALTNSAKLCDSRGSPFESRCPPLERVTSSLNESSRRPPRVTSIHPQSVKNFPRVSPWGLEDDLGIIRVHRSEEHTSELQSLMRISYAVFCLKKKTNKVAPQDTNKNNNENHHNHTKHIQYQTKKITTH